MILDQDNSLLLIIDIQEKLLKAVFNKELLEKKAKILTEACSILNIPVYIRIKSNKHTYVFKDMVDQMQKVITNNDFNISSITLKGWGKILSSLT